MLTISKPLSSGQAQTYHAKEFTSAEQNYWKQGEPIQGEWQGKLAEEYGLAGAVDAQHFAGFSEGQNPQTGEQMVRHRTAQEYTTADGNDRKPVEHRAGWDATFSAPKSVSLTALVGGDDRVREAHRQAVTIALTELERYTQARIGGNNPAETTGKFIAAKFEHDTARPGGWLRRAAAPYPCRHLQYDRAGGWLDARIAGARLLREPAVRDRRLPIGADVPAPQSRLRDRGRQERRARDQRLLAGVS